MRDDLARSLRRRAGRWFAFTFLLLAAPAVACPDAAADDDPGAPDAAGPLDPREVLPEAAADQLHEMLAWLIRENLPERYEDEKDWGRTKRVYAGVSVRRDGWELKTHRRWRQRNHGRWQRAAVELVDPDRTLHVTCAPLRQLPEGRWAFDVAIEAAVALSGRVSRWNLGLRLWSISAEADARVRLRIRGSFALKMDASRVPPDVVFDPVVDEADLRVARFRLNRVSHLGSDLAKPLGKALEDLLEDKVVAPQRKRLAERLNAQIDRRRDRLRLSPADWIERWLTPAAAGSATPSGRGRGR